MNTIEAFVLSSVLLTFTGTAFAQNNSDQWRGPYLGATLGSTSSFGDIEPTGNADDDVDLDDGGASFGLVAGYNFSPFGRSNNGGWLIGLEADLQTISTDTNETDPVIGNYELEGTWTASFRLRGGYAWEKYHLYTTLGVAFTDLDLKTDNGSGDTQDKGIALGLGLERKFSDLYTGRLEAMIYGFGEEDRQINGTKHDVSVGSTVVRLGITRKF